MVLLFFDFGSGEILLIVLAIFLVFGPGKIPEIARNLGRFINEMKRATEDIKTEINREAERQERKKKLEEYKKQLNLDGIQEEKKEEQSASAAETASPEEDKKEPPRKPATDNTDKKDIKEKSEEEKEPEQGDEKPLIRKPEGSVPNG